MEELLESVVLEKPVSTPTTGFDVERIREDFPILQTRVHGNPLVYLDNAATSQKPQAVIDAISDYYSGENANIHRGVHYLSELATRKYEETREKVKDLINAKSTREIIFVRGTTEAVNLISSTYGRENIKAEDEIIISNMEHHSNIVPWQLLCESTDAKLEVIPINDDGEIIFDEYQKLMNDKTKLVAVVHTSNSLGTINPVKRIIEVAHSHNVPVLLDGAQAVPHQKIDVQELDCDFFAFSSHKFFGPTGVGVLFAKEDLLEKMPPYEGGGEMITSVTFEKTTYNELPHKFEAGTPNIAGVVALGAAIDYVNEVGYENIHEHEDELLKYATEALSSIKSLRIIGTAAKKASVISFTLDNIHPHDMGTVLDRQGIAVRTGHHCTQPVMERFNVPATTRASFAFYNTKEEVDRLVEGIHHLLKLFG